MSFQPQSKQSIFLDYMSSQRRESQRRSQSYTDNNAWQNDPVFQQMNPGIQDIFTKIHNRFSENRLRVESIFSNENNQYLMRLTFSFSEPNQRNYPFFQIKMKRCRDSPLQTFFNYDYQYNITYLSIEYYPSGIIKEQMMQDIKLGAFEELKMTDEHKTILINIQLITVINEALRCTLDIINKHGLVHPAPP